MIFGHQGTGLQLKSVGGQTCYIDITMDDCMQGREQERLTYAGKSLRKADGHALCGEGIVERCPHLLEFVGRP